MHPIGLILLLTFLGIYAVFGDQVVHENVPDHKDPVVEEHQQNPSENVVEAAVKETGTLNHTNEIRCNVIWIDPDTNVEYFYNTKYNTLTPRLQADGSPMLHKYCPK